MRFHGNIPYRHVVVAFEIKKDDSNYAKGYRTDIKLVGGHSCVTSTPYKDFSRQWKEAMAAEERDDLARIGSLAYFEGRKAELEQQVAELEAARDMAAPKSLVASVLAFIRSGKQYPTKATKDQWARMIEESK